MVPLAEELSAFAGVFAPDLPGFGRSSKPRRVLAVSELAETLAESMDAAGVPGGTLIGNSFGCQIAVELAVRDRPRADRLVLIGPTIDRRARTAPAQILRFLRTGLHETPSLALVLVREYLDAGPRRILRTFQHSLRDPVEEKLPRVGVPTLVIRGSHDALVPQRWAEEVARLLPAGRLAVIAGGAHALNYTAPSHVSRLVRAFMDEAAA